MRIIKIIFISIASLLGILVILFFLFIVGITTDVSSDNIDDSDLLKCKEIVGIVDRNKEFINDSIIKEATRGGFGNSACIRYGVVNKNDIDKLFSKINMTDKKRFEELVESKFCEYIEISEAKDCIMFQMRTSRHNWAIIGKYKQLFVIYEDKPICNCKDNPIGDPNYAEFVKKISDKWYITKVGISKRYFGC
jgi:hypothetical protein